MSCTVLVEDFFMAEYIMHDYTTKPKLRYKLDTVTCVEHKVSLGSLNCRTIFTELRSCVYTYFQLSLRVKSGSDDCSPTTLRKVTYTLTYTRDDIVRYWLL